MNSISLLVRTLVALCLIGRTDMARILAVPGISRSTHVEFQSLAQELHKRGHEIYIAVGHCFKLPKSVNDGSVKILTFKCFDEDYILEHPDFHKKMIPMQLASPGPMAMMKLFGFLTDYLSKYYEAMLTDQTFIKTAKELKFDLAIINSVSFAQGVILLPYKLDLPFIVASAQNWAFKAGAPMLPSFVPFPVFPFTDNMTFIQRAMNLLPKILHDFLFAVTPAYMSKTVHEKPVLSQDELYARAELFIATGTHPAIDYPVPSMPNVVYAGGLATRPAEPLPSELEDFMQKWSKEGVIVVSFGTVITYLPDHIFKTLFEALGRVKYGVIMRYASETKIGTIASNIKLLKWLPQNDLLGHNATKLFITHCGNSGQYEGLYHGVPMINMPVNGDQFYNALRSESKGYSITMKLGEFTADELVTTINEMMTNPIYREKIQKGSKVYHSFPMSARKLAAYWVEYVLQFGGKHLQSKAASMPWYQYYMFDVLLFYAVVISTVIWLIFSIIKYIVITCCFKRTTIKKKEKSG